jgi:Ca-activated chloride channel family protein
VNFASPLWLLGLLALPLLLAAYALRERARARAAAVWSTPALLPNLVDRAPGVRRHLPIALLLVALAAMIVGVARPHATVTVRRE